MSLMAAFVPHRPNKYFHVTASNGIVSNSPYIPLAIMTASPIASVRVFEVRSTIDRAIIMLNDCRFWGHASGPSSPGKTLHRFIRYWHPVPPAAAPYRASGLLLWREADIRRNAKCRLSGQKPT
jgi:hypothetical protein